MYSVQYYSQSDLPPRADLVAGTLDYHTTHHKIIFMKNKFKSRVCVLYGYEYANHTVFVHIFRSFGFRSELDASK